MSDNVRVYEIAEEAGASSTEVITKAKDLGIELKSPQSAVSFEDAEEIANYIMTGKSSKLEKKAEPKKVKKPQSKTIDKSETKVETQPETVIEKKPETEKKVEPKIVEETKTQPVVNTKTAVEPAKTEVKVEAAKVDEPKKVEASKEEPAKVEAAKVEPTKVESKVEVKIDASGVKKIIPKRRGLKIVKKKKPKVVEPVIDHSAVQPKKQMKSLSEILGGSNALNDRMPVDRQPRQKTQKKRVAAKAHEHGKVLNAPGNKDFKESDDSILGEEVVLLDMDLQDTSKLFEDEAKKDNKSEQRNQVLLETDLKV